TPVPFVVSDIKDEHGNWFPSFHILGDAAAGKTTHLYLYVPKGSHPQALRMRGYKKASVVEKAQYGLRLLSEKTLGRYPGKQVWFEKLSVPTYEFIVKIGTKPEPARSRPQPPSVPLSHTLRETRCSLASARLGSRSAVAERYA